MLRRFIAKIRETISPSAKTPSPKTPAAGHGAGAAPHRSSAARTHGDGHGHGQSPRPQGKSGGKAPERPREVRESRESRPRRDESGDSRGSRGSSRGERRGSSHGERRGRPARDDFEHPRREPVKPVTPVDVPKMDTAFPGSAFPTRSPTPSRRWAMWSRRRSRSRRFPLVLAGGDVIGSAQTGTGKTAAFALPIIQRLGSHGALRCLVLEPTRELALQVEEAFQKFAKFTDLRVTIVYGGVGYGKQNEDLRRGHGHPRRDARPPARPPGAGQLLARTGSTSWSSTRWTACSTWDSCPT